MPVWNVFELYHCFTTFGYIHGRRRLLAKKKKKLPLNAVMVNFTSKIPLTCTQTGTEHHTEYFWNIPTENSAVKKQCNPLNHRDPRLFYVDLSLMARHNIMTTHS